MTVTTVTTRAPVDLPRGADAVAALAVALWPYTADGDLVVRVRAGGRYDDLAVSYADGGRPLRELCRPAAADAGPYVVLVDQPMAEPAPVVLTLRADGADLSVADPAVDARLLAARIGYAARALHDDPTRPVEQLPPGEAERDRLRAWIGPPVPYGDTSTVDGVVAAVAARHPGRVALRHGDDVLTYGELLARADRLAADLRGCGPVVVVRMPRGIDLVVALLATLRAGAAYCAVDPRWPAARVQAIVADTRARRLLGAPPAGYAPPRLSRQDIDTDGGFCVYFTSGSTGRPKGVLSTHRGTLRTLLAPRRPRLGPDTVTLSAAPLPWDAFTLELWSALLHGGTCVFPGQDHLTPAELRRGVAAGVNTMWLTASLFNLLVDEDVEAFTGLRQVLTGGERLSVPHVARFRRRHPDIALVNGYGPVEATVFATTHDITDADLSAPGGIPIGAALPGTEVLVLRRTASGREVRAAIGEPGEICVAGDGLAVGYMGPAAAQNAERFPVLRLEGEPPVRVYRTGDVGVWRGDGVLLFRGRADRQVKLRGHRVEPGEIETVALTGGMVRQCAVLPVYAEGRVTALAAYVVPRAEPFDPAAFVARLAEALPAYLVPAHVVALPALPLGATGKLDTTALPPVSPATVARVGAPAGVSSPAGPRERTVAELAADLLGMPVAPDDDLLGLGLDSLGATRLAARLARRLGVEAEVVTVLRERTPRAIAAVLPAPRSVPEPAAGPPVLSDGQVRFWLDDMMRPDRALGNVVLLAFRFTGPIPAAELHRGLRGIVTRHDALRTAVVDDDGVPVPVALPAEAALRIDHEPTDQADPAGYAATLAASVDLTAGPIVAVRTVTQPDGVLLLLAVHHAAFDGDSVALLAAELSALLRGETLPAVPSYAGYAARRAAGLAGPEVMRLATEWAERLRAAEDLRWPGPAPNGTAPAIAEIPLTVPATTASALAERARLWRVTPYTVALAAFTEALHEVTGIDRFCVGTPVSDRDPVDAATIGLFVATLALPAEAGAARTGEAGAGLPGSVARTAATVLDGLAHRTVPLGDVLRLLRRRGGTRHPLFQAQLAWQNHARAEWDIPGVEVAEIRVPPLVAQHELTLELHPAAGDAPLAGVVEYDPGANVPGVAVEVAEAFLRHLDRLCG